MTVTGVNDVVDREVKTSALEKLAQEVGSTLPGVFAIAVYGRSLQEVLVLYDGNPQTKQAVEGYCDKFKEIMSHSAKPHVRYRDCNRTQLPSCMERLYANNLLEVLYPKKEST